MLTAKRWRPWQLLLSLLLVQRQHLQGTVNCIVLVVIPGVPLACET